MCVCDIGGGDDLFDMRVRHAVGDIVEDGVREHHRFLLNIADAAAVILQVDIADIDVVKENFALIVIIEAQEQVYERRFAGACRADDADDVAGLYRHIDIREGLFCLVERKVDMAEFDLAPDAFGLQLFSEVGFGFGVDYIKKSFG